MLADLSIVLILSQIGLLAIKLLAFLVIIFVIATIHEMGHHLVCKMTGVRVDEFSIGFGKLLWGRRWGETDYCIRAIPIAAYVRPAGMDPEESKLEGYVDPGPRSFNRKNSLIKHLILLAGPAFNIMTTVLVFTFVNAYLGYEETTIKVSKVTAGWPAEKAGIRPGDIFLAMDGQRIVRWHKAIQYIKDRVDRPIRITLRRDGATRDIEVVPRHSERLGRGLIGIESGQHVLAEGKTLPFPRALDTAMVDTLDEVVGTWEAAIDTLQSLAKLRAPPDIGGPVSIVRVVGNQVEHGELADRARNLIRIFAILSLAIGVFNLLPIPALDGGRMFVIVIRDLLDLGYMILFWRWPRTSVLSDTMERYVHFAGLILLLVLLIVVTFKDIGDIFTPPSPPPQPGPPPP